MSVPSLLLASGSPRRAALLTELGFTFRVVTPLVEEVRIPGEDPAGMVVRLAVAKVAAFVGADVVVLGVDTAVVLDEETIGKPRDKADAIEILLRLGGRKHVVMSGWAIVAREHEESGVEQSIVELRALTGAEAASYAAGGEPMDKAGAYAIQGEGRRFVKGFEGSFSNVMGLPMEAVVPALARAGITPSMQK